MGKMAGGGDVIAAAGFLVRRADANWEGQGGRTTLRSKRFEMTIGQLDV